MKIALTTDSFVEGHGGVSTAVAALARCLRQRGYQVMIYTAADPSHKQMDLDVVGFRALRYERFPGGRAPMAPIALVQELADFRPDVIHNHSMSAMGLQALAAGHLLGIPVLGTCHVFLAGFLKYAPISLDGVPLTEDIAWKYTTAFFNRFPQVTTPSEAMRRELVTHGLRVPVMAISNGVDTDLFHPIPKTEIEASRPPVVLHVGRLGYEKRVDLVIRAFARLLDGFPAARLVIVGDGPEKEELQALATEKGVSRQVDFVGEVPHEHLPAYYQQADLFVTASTIETQGLVVLEAMACGLPIAGVEAMALPDLIQQDVNGIIASPNDEEQLAFGMAHLLSSEKLCQEMGHASHRMALKHSLSAVTQDYERLYRQAISQAPAPLLQRIPQKLDPSIAWSSLHAEGQALIEAGVHQVWSISRILQNWREDGFAEATNRIRNIVKRLPGRRE